MKLERPLVRGRRVTALRDAALLAGNLAKAGRRAMSLTDAVRDYETKMIAYGFNVVAKPRQYMSGDAAIHKGHGRGRLPRRGRR